MSLCNTMASEGYFSEGEEPRRVNLGQRRRARWGEICLAHACIWDHRLYCRLRARRYFLTRWDHEGSDVGSALVLSPFRLAPLRWARRWKFYRILSAQGKSETEGRGRCKGRRDREGRSGRWASGEEFLRRTINTVLCCTVV